MKSNTSRTIFFLIFLVIILFSAGAEDKRVLPLDLYLIIDGSASLESSKNDTFAWICDKVIDRILVDGDKITIWNAGDRAQVIYSAALSEAAGKSEIKEKIRGILLNGKTADFSGALRDAAGRVSQTAADRLAVTMLVTASAEGLEPALSGSSQGLFRWFRSEQYERWQVLIIAPDIGKKVQQSAADYMSSLR